MLKNKTVLLGVSGSIAAYKMANVASSLIKMGANVHVLMTANATNFINPITFETLTGNKCLVDTFDRNFNYSVEHVSLAKQADVFMLAPATANVIGKIASGIADDMLTTTFMACKCPKLIAPAMNTNMYENPIVTDNINKLKAYGMTIVSPDCGRLACGDTGAGKLPKEEVLIDYILREIHFHKDLEGKKVLVTAGPTREAIDPVRYISNLSTGKMGYAIARCAMERGAKVTLVTGPTSIARPPFVDVVDVVSAKDMYEAVIGQAADMDMIIMSAAVADYTPADVADEKLKKSDDDLSIKLNRTKDILYQVGNSKRYGQIVCGFAMETQNLLDNAKAKLLKKNADMIVANSLRTEGAGFGVDTNVVTFITKDGCETLPLMSKDEVAYNILSKLLNI